MIPAGRMRDAPDTLLAPRRPRPTGRSSGHQSDVSPKEINTTHSVIIYTVLKKKKNTHTQQETITNFMPLNSFLP